MTEKKVISNHYFPPWNYFESIAVMTLTDSPRIEEFKQNLILSGFNLNKVTINVNKKPKSKDPKKPIDASLWKILFKHDETCTNESIRNMTKNHYKIIKKALDTNKKNVLVFEDDARFTLPLNIKKITYAIDWLRNNENWDVFYFGQIGAIPFGIPVNAHIYKVPHAYCAHAYALNRSGMQYVVDNLNLKLHIDSIDSALYKFPLKRYSIFPCVNFQSEWPSLTVSHGIKQLLSNVGLDSFETLCHIENYVSYFSIPIIIIIILLIFRLFRRGKGNKNILDKVDNQVFKD